MINWWPHLSRSDPPATSRSPAGALRSSYGTGGSATGAERDQGGDPGRGEAPLRVAGLRRRDGPHDSGRRGSERGREGKKLELATRTALADSALRLSVERGIESVTVEQIAVDAGVSLRTFFNYFSSKEEAIVAGDLATAGQLVTAFSRRPASEPVLEALRQAVLDIVPEQIDR
jgi:hypothetical protein